MSRSPTPWSTGACALGALARSEEALAAYEEVLARFGDTPEPAPREVLARLGYVLDKRSQSG